MSAADLRKFRDPVVDTVAVELVTKVIVLEAVIAAMTTVAHQREAEIARLELLLDERRGAAA